MATRIDELRGMFLAGMSHGVRLAKASVMDSDDTTASAWWNEGYEVGLMMRGWRQGTQLEVGIVNYLDHKVNEIGLHNPEEGTT